jgi:hypothetical protein
VECIDVDAAVLGGFFFTRWRKEPPSMAARIIMLVKLVTPMQPSTGIRRG